MRRLPCLLLCCLALLAAPVPAPAQPTQGGQRFVSIAFHDVVDDARDLEGDAITTDHLIAFFEWLRADGWNPIRLDDLDAARAGHRPLPPKAILVSFDDGYLSLYTRVWPLIRAYRIPIVAALVGSWMAPLPGGTVRYGDLRLPREKFISWPQVREMARSELVEFASHSHDLHRGILANPQGSQMPAASTALYTPGLGYEDDTATRTRLRTDLQASRAQFERELGRAPRAIVWPFGRYSALAAEVAHELGFEFALTLDPRPASSAEPIQIARFLPDDNPTPAVLAAALRFDDPLPSARRWICLDPAHSWDADPARANERLGDAIERVRALGATAVVLDMLQSRADGSIAAWFPTPHLPLAGDWLSRLSWQLQTRAGVDVYLRLPSRAPAIGVSLAALADEAARMVPMAGLLIDEPGLLIVDDAQEPDAGAPWTLRLRRAAARPAEQGLATEAALAAFNAAARRRPGLRLALLDRRSEAPLLPSTLADLTLYVRAVDAPSTGPLLPPLARRRVGLWYEAAAAPEAATLTRAMRGFQQRGGTAFGWCPDDLPAGQPEPARVAPAFSASTFPLKP
ncbi:MAG: poly-beta,6-N-acetyl-D-glucosamine N-deacetylase PgaB [Pseudomonadota bacterium]|jgi:peptidoglycan/xylan/chitin deacetylase (PgdA/CDA1 family)